MVMVHHFLVLQLTTSLSITDWHGQLDMVGLSLKAAWEAIIATATTKEFISHHRTNAH
jgi:hypothetical protein